MYIIIIIKSISYTLLAQPKQNISPDGATVDIVLMAHDSGGLETPVFMSVISWRWHIEFIYGVRSLRKPSVSFIYSLLKNIKFDVNLSIKYFSQLDNVWVLAIYQETTGNRLPSSDKWGNSALKQIRIIHSKETLWSCDEC